MTSLSCKEPPREQLLAISHASKSHRETMELDSGSPRVAPSKPTGDGEGEGPPIWAGTFLRRGTSPRLPEKSIDRWSRCDRNAAPLSASKTSLSAI
ncbi:hypothetical protein KM043_017264 [Ampulex compressa]|nr:hypothetical protein KM043_017264 [Ampulex compressa]